jgi:hypothetical protein
MFQNECNFRPVRACRKYTTPFQGFSPLAIDGCPFGAGLQLRPIRNGSRMNRPTPLRGCLRPKGAFVNSQAAQAPGMCFVPDRKAPTGRSLVCRSQFAFLRLRFPLLNAAQTFNLL